MTIDPLWLDALRQRLDMPPLRAADAVGRGGRGRGPCHVGSLEPDLARPGAAPACRCATPATPGARRPGASDVDAALARLAARRTGLAGRVARRIARRGRRRRPASRRHRTRRVRPLGVATRAVHLVLTLPRRAVWVQQRSFDKAIDPGLWDTPWAAWSPPGNRSRARGARNVGRGRRRRSPTLPDPPVRALHRPAPGVQGLHGRAHRDVRRPSPRRRDARKSGRRGRRFACLTRWNCDGNCWPTRSRSSRR